MSFEEAVRKQPEERDYRIRKASGKLFGREATLCLWALVRPFVNGANYQLVAGFYDSADESDSKWFVLKADADLAFETEMKKYGLTEEKSVEPPAGATDAP